MKHVYCEVIKEKETMYINKHTWLERGFFLLHTFHSLHIYVLYLCTIMMKLNGYMEDSIKTTVVGVYIE